MVIIWQLSPNCHRGKINRHFVTFAKLINSAYPIIHCCILYYLKMRHRVVKFLERFDGKRCAQEFILLLRKCARISILLFFPFLLLCVTIPFNDRHVYASLFQRREFRACSSRVSEQYWTRRTSFFSQRCVREEQRDLFLPPETINSFAEA